MTNMTTGTMPTSNGYQTCSSPAIGQDKISHLAYLRTKGTSLEIILQKGHRLNLPPPGQVHPRAVVNMHHRGEMIRAIHKINTTLQDRQASLPTELLRVCQTILLHTQS